MGFTLLEQETDEMQREVDMPLFYSDTEKMDLLVITVLYRPAIRAACIPLPFLNVDYVPC